ncbi:hypothetical protein GSB9_01147 [Flavobacteriaceae bacterium GSB9]|nr:hypothetical protein GSB9_01147 [Flavobacteriaceae bacterium GSB9]
MMRLSPEQFDLFIDRIVESIKLNQPAKQQPQIVPQYIIPYPYQMPMPSTPTDKAYVDSLKTEINMLNKQVKQLQDLYLEMNKDNLENAKKKDADNKH